MSTLAEIEKATEKLSMEQKQQLMSFLGTQMRGTGSKPKAPSHLTAAKRAEEFKSWAASHKGGPGLPDSATSRNSIYG
jgi:hypothetical protein